MTIEELSKLSEKEIILFFAMMTDEEKLFWRQEQINNAIEMEQKKQAEQEQKDWAFGEVGQSVIQYSIRKNESWVNCSMISSSSLWNVLK